MKPFSEAELNERIALNRRRLTEPYYQIGSVFSPKDYDWQGDKEGRALLAFTCHEKMGGAIPTARQMLSQWREKTNEFLYFGTTDHEILSEQQLSGHNWVLCALCEQYALHGDPFVKTVLDSAVRSLYLPAKGRFPAYPTTERRQGGVAGTAQTEAGGFLLSSDVGCAFMSIDGLSRYYGITRRADVFDLLDEMITVFLSIDKEQIRAQTHCSLTAARGILRLFFLTGQRRFLDGAEEIARLYLRSGMTLTDQNLNWWGRPDSWTEPCAIVDSLILFAELFRATGNARYRRMAARVAHNALASAQRGNGGAGTDYPVLPGQPILRMHMDEAPFCCSMRLAEGLLYLKEHRSLFSAETAPGLSRDPFGRVCCGDLLYTEYLPDAPWAEYFDLSAALPFEGKTFVPLLKLYRVPMELLPSVTQRILY